MTQNNSLFQAAAAGDLSRLQQLLADQPQTANTFSDDGFTPLHLACAANHPEAVRLLIEKGADINAPARNEHQERPLHRAVASGNPDLVLLLLEKGADINAPQSEGLTPLHEAARQGNEAIIKLLLEHMADINAMTREGKTPMEMAIAHGHDAGKWFTM